MRHTRTLRPTNTFLACCPHRGLRGLNVRASLVALVAFVAFAIPCNLRHDPRPQTQLGASTR